MLIERPTDADVMFVLNNAWSGQHAELAAMRRPQESMSEYAQRMVRMSAITHALYRESVPYCVGGMWLEGRHVAGTWLIHTEEALQYHPYIVLAVRRLMRNMAKLADVHTFQATTLEHEKTARFYKALGMSKVCDLPGEGTNGETLALYERRGVT